MIRIGFNTTHSGGQGCQGTDHVRRRIKKEAGRLGDGHWDTGCPRARRVLLPGPPSISTFKTPPLASLLQDCGAISAPFDSTFLVPSFPSNNDQPVRGRVRGLETI